MEIFNILLFDLWMVLLFSAVDLRFWNHTFKLRVGAKRLFFDLIIFRMLSKLQ